MQKDNTLDKSRNTATMVQCVHLTADRKLALRLSVSAVVAIMFAFAPTLKPHYVDPLWMVITTLVVQEKTLVESAVKSCNRAIGTALGGLIGTGLGYLSYASGVDQGVSMTVLNMLFVFVGLLVWYTFIKNSAFLADMAYAVSIGGFSLAMAFVATAQGETTAAAKRTVSIVMGIGIAFFVSLVLFPASAEEEMCEILVKALRKLSEIMSRVVEEAADTDSPKAFDYRRDAIFKEAIDLQSLLFGRGSALVKVSKYELWPRITRNDESWWPWKLTFKVTPGEEYALCMRSTRRLLQVNGMVHPYLQNKVFVAKWSPSLLASIKASIREIAAIVDQLAGDREARNAVLPRSYLDHLEMMVQTHIQAMNATIAANLGVLSIAASQASPSHVRRRSKMHLSPGRLERLDTLDLGQLHDPVASLSRPPPEVPPRDRIDTLELGNLAIPISSSSRQNSPAVGEITSSLRHFVEELTPEEIKDIEEQQSIRSLLGSIACQELLLRLMLRMEQLLRDLSRLENAEYLRGRHFAERAF